MMVHNYPQRFPTRRQHYQSTGRQALSGVVPRFASNKNMSKHGDRLELDPENYTAYVLLQLFDALYQPWLKECNAAKFASDFNSRLDHLNQSLESAFPHYVRLKGRVVPMARRHCFSILRKLKVAVDDVRSTVDNSKQKITGKCLRVRILTKKGPNGMEEAFYHSNSPILLHSSFSMYLDIPMEMNDNQTKVQIQFLMSENPPPEEQQQLQNTDAMHFSMLGQEILLVVKEYEISGFTGYSNKCIVFDDQTGENVSFNLNLSWDLNVKSIIEQIKWLDIVACHFSSALLALGTYFWRFYSSLYMAMLLQPNTEIQAIKCLNEVAFLIGPQQKKSLFKPMLKLMDKRLLPTDIPPAQCDPEQCFIQFRLVHGAVLLLELLSVEDQQKLLSKVHQHPFCHLLRFKCSVLCSDQLLQLHRLCLRRMFVVVKKSKYRTRTEIDPHFDFLVGAMIDHIKRRDVFDGLTEEELTQLQEDTVTLFAKFYIKVADIEEEEAKVVANEENYNSEKDNGGVEGDETDDNEYSSCSAEQNSQLTSSAKYEDATNSSESFLEPVAAEQATTTADVEQQLAKYEERAIVDTELDLAYHHFVSHPDQQAEDCALVHSVLPNQVMHKLYEEEMLEPDNYQHTMALLRKIAHQIETLRNEKDE